MEGLDFSNSDTYAQTVAVKGSRSDMRVLREARGGSLRGSSDPSG